MKKPLKRLIAAALVLLTAGSPPPLSVVEANDNRIAGGQLANGELTLDLVADMARWYPENVGGPYTEIPAFHEEGRAPQIPAPLIRVPVGTRVKLRIRNALVDQRLTVFGLGVAPGPDSTGLHVEAGASRTFEYDAATPGTYFYTAVATNADTMLVGESQQLSGALVVDAPGDRTDDRILVMNIWSRFNIRDRSFREALAINGKSWPFTERLEATVGDSLHWRVVNTTFRGHPMHLHGAYFRVDALGDAKQDSTFVPEKRLMVVTQDMLPFSTMRMVSSPETPGNWLFHCHLAYHVSPEARLDPPKPDQHAGMAHDAGRHMAGLIMGIHVRPRPGDIVPRRRNVRRLDLYAVGGVRTDTTMPHPRSFVTRRGAPVGAIGDLIVVTRGEPTDITVHNQLDQPTAVHWHGIELESYSDGVPGFSGQGPRMSPPVAPGESFVARLTLKRAGTFMYHTHLNDIEQLVGGMYGPLVVLEPGQRWDPTRDFVFVAGQNSFRLDSLLVNGTHEEPPISMRVGESYRLRFVNITPANSFNFQIWKDSTLARWRPVAKDGYELPPSQATERPARQRVSLGSTFDAEFTPREAGTYQLRAMRSSRARYLRTLVVR